MTGNSQAISAIGAFQLVCVLLVTGMIGINALYLAIVRRVNPVALFTSRDGRLRIMDVLFSAGILVFFGRVLLQAIGLPVLLLPWPLGLSVLTLPAARVAGGVAIVAAVALFATAYRQLGVSWRVGIDEGNPGSLVTSGVFRRTRNPIYLAADLYVIGTFLINGTIVFLLFATFAPVFLHAQILLEERALVRIHGSVYVEYCLNVGRYWTRLLWL